MKLSFVTSLQQVERNVSYIDAALLSRNPDLSAFARNLIRRGHCFYVKKKGKKFSFYPSKFIGFPNMTFQKYEEFKLYAHDFPNFDGRLTNQALVKIIGRQVQKEDNKTLHTKLEKEYMVFCQRLDINPAQIKNRRYWYLNDFEKQLKKSISSAVEFPEGPKKERLHKYRERNSAVVKQAKALFYEKHGRFFCEACRFDFESHYGNLGEYFIEAHHSIPVKSMKKGHKTKIEDLAMLCANCHRMIHKSKEWISIEAFKKIIRKRN